MPDRKPSEMLISPVVRAGLGWPKLLNVAQRLSVGPHRGLGLLQRVQECGGRKRKYREITPLTKAQGIAYCPQVTPGLAVSGAGITEKGECGACTRIRITSVQF